jgi:hypothetical protein
MKRVLAVLVAMSFLSAVASAAPAKKPYSTSHVVSKKASKKGFKRSSSRISSKRGRSKKGGFAKTRTVKAKGAKPVKRARR